MKIALGSVQFGQAYGAFNDAGQVSIAEVEAILDMARSHGITTLDTAQAYGASEEVLGRLEAGKHFTIVTKIPSLAGTSDRAAAIKRCITQSCEALKVQRLDALLFHSANDLLGDSAETCWRTAEQAYLAACR
jgi:aryl-alcohol dehydrogenase-like predicted oxidoreductase